MRYLTLAEALQISQRVLAPFGRAPLLRNLHALESALAQPRMTFVNKELYPTLAEKAAALGFSTINNHPFLDGNKRIGHALMEVFLILNGYEIQAAVDEQERMVFAVAAGEVERDALAQWLAEHMVPLKK